VGRSYLVVYGRPLGSPVYYRKMRRTVQEEIIKKEQGFWRSSIK